VDGRLFENVAVAISAGTPLSRAGNQQPVPHRLETTQPTPNLWFDLELICSIHLFHKTNWWLVTNYMTYCVELGNALNRGIEWGGPSERRESCEEGVEWRTVWREILEGGWSGGTL